MITLPPAEKAVAPPVSSTRENGSTPSSLGLNHEPYLCIEHVDQLDPFLMSLSSSGNHWLFVGSNSPFTAGRTDPDNALFPYQTVDKILRHADSGGAITLFQITKGGRTVLWEPWQRHGSRTTVSRHLHKHAHNTSVAFEEIHHDLQLDFRWNLTTSVEFGFIRRCVLRNHGTTPATIRYLDGWHQIQPPGLSADMAGRYSYLANAYMRHEADGILGIYTLNARITDRAEPSESLRAACAWSIGHSNPALLLSGRQMDRFRAGMETEAEGEVRGVIGAHLIEDSVTLEPSESFTWISVIDTGLDHAAIANLRNRLQEPNGLQRDLEHAIRKDTDRLRHRIAAADGMQETADRAASAHHFVNVLFNCQRGGTLLDGYFCPAKDFADFLQSRNVNIRGHHDRWLSTLPSQISLTELRRRTASLGDPHLERLTLEYLPIHFGRRHGDPSRPWNRFSIRLEHEDGTPLLGYEGNWRDIFQNWESLAHSYPECLPSMLAIFLNASTADGYNPYRISRQGVDWEVVDPNDPWSHMGYWGDHQIVYLLRILEACNRFHPEMLAANLRRRIHAYTIVPYEIAGFAALARDPKHSIRFNGDLHRSLQERAEAIGNDAKLVSDSQGNVILISLAEKLLVPLLAKLSNFVPGGGVWLNTQRPEWNDANNALAGWGLSVVTTCYLRRYLVFLDDLFAKTEGDICLSAAVARFIRDLATILSNGTLQAERRWDTIEALGHAGETHRASVYGNQLGSEVAVSIKSIRKLLRDALIAVDSTIRANRRRSDSTYHSYNVLSLSDKAAAVEHLPLMLEGQVAVLSSGLLSAEESISLLDAMRQSTLYCADRCSYLLQPEQEIPHFLRRNRLSEDALRLPLFAAMVAAGDRRVVAIDENGQAHFHADLTNATDLARLLDRIAAESRWKPLIERDRSAVLDCWEAVFRHRSFTGRSGTMFAFEGVGSIYWHMVAKLLLAVRECHGIAVAGKATPDAIAALAHHYYEIRSGLGFTKTSERYGAFPIDPYSHTPRGRGAQQPGMTGQVKETILTRIGELGVEIENGRIRFAPVLLRGEEFISYPHAFLHLSQSGTETSWNLPAESLAFTFCQVPICYVAGDAAALTIEYASGHVEVLAGNTLSDIDSRSIFARNGKISRILFTVPASTLLSPIPREP